VDNNNNIFITGGTVSDNFPSKTAYDSSYNGDNDVFVSKLDVAGHLVWSTFFGSGNDEIGWKVKVDPTFTNLYVTGEGSSCQTPIKTFGSYNDTTGGGFISKYDLNGNLIWSTQFGGGCESVIKAIQFNNAGDYFIIGGSTSDSGLDTMNVKINGTYSGGTLDCFISKFKTSNNSLVWSEYYGGTDSELLQSCIIDSHDNIYFAGQTKSDSSSFPLKDYSNSSDYFDNTLELDDAFVLETDSSGSMLWSTYIGGNNGEVIFDLAVDSHDDLVCSGITYSNQDLLDTNHANGFFNDNSLDGFSDAFLFAFNKNKVSLWSTYFGGFGGLSEVFNDMDVSFNRLYIAGASSSNSNFPIVASLGAFVDSFPSPNLGKGIFTKFNITNLFVIGNDEIDKNSIQPLVYPIPTHNFIRIPIDKIKSNNITLGLYDILGQEKVNKTILSTETIVTLSLNEFDAGLYFLYIAFDDNKYVYKIIKE
jgi:hypothetical protein